MKDDPNVHLDDLANRFASTPSRSHPQAGSRPRHRAVPRIKGLTLSITLAALAAVGVGLMLLLKG